MRERCSTKYSTVSITNSGGSGVGDKITGKDVVVHWDMLPYHWLTRRKV